MTRALICVLLGVACSNTTSTTTGTPDRGPAVTMIAIDVGQGDATLIIGTDGTVVLIDGGGLRSQEVLRAAISAETGGRVDHVVATHYDADHLAGLADYLLGSDRQPRTSDDGAPSATLWDYGDDMNCTTQTCDRYRLSRVGRATVMVPGDEISLGEARLRCVAVNGEVLGQTRVTPSDENARSISLLLEYGDFRALFAGDLTGGGEGTSNVELPVARATGAVDLLHVNHHGSRTSSNADALSLWIPRASVISVGTGNSYCHPAADVLTRLTSVGTRIFSTGRGTVTPDNQCNRATSWPEDARPGIGTIRMSAYRDRTLYVVDEELP